MLGSSKIAKFLRMSTKKVICHQPYELFRKINLVELAKLMRLKKKHSRKACRVVELEIMKKVIKPWIFEENQWILSSFGHIPVQKCLRETTKSESVNFSLFYCAMVFEYFFDRIEGKCWETYSLLYATICGSSRGQKNVGKVVIPQKVLKNHWEIHYRP